MEITGGVVEILKLGLTGLVFLLMVMGFRLLQKEQGMEKPSREVLRRASLFVWQSIVVAGLVGAVHLASYFGGDRAGSAESQGACAAEVAALHRVARHPGQTLDTLRSGVRNTWVACGSPGEATDEG